MDKHAKLKHAKHFCSILNQRLASPRRHSSSLHKAAGRNIASLAANVLQHSDEHRDGGSKPPKMILVFRSDR